MGSETFGVFMFTLTDHKVDLPRLRHEITRFMDWYPIYGYEKQWSFTFTESDGDQDPTVIHNTRALVREGKLSEIDNKVFHYRFRDTALYELYQALSEVYKIGRVRLMALNPYQCYSFHADTEIRFHVVLWTNPKAFFIIHKLGRDGNGKPIDHIPLFDMSDQLGVYHIPANGRVYSLDANHTHTALNGGSEVRYHLVFNTIPKSK